MKSSIMIQFYRVLFCLLLLVLLPSCKNDKSGLQSGDPSDFKDAVLINQYGITSISISAKNPIIQTGKTQQYTATGNTATGGTVDISQDVHWTVSKTAIAKIDDSGLLTGLAQGDVIVTAVLSSFTISAPALHVTDGSVNGITITDSSGGNNFTVDACKTLKLKAEATYSGETLVADITDQVQWTTAATNSVAHFSTAANKNGWLFTSAISSSGFEVSAKLNTLPSNPQTVITQDGFTTNTSGITVTADSNTLAINSTVQFTANATFDDGTTEDITNTANWSSDNTSIATVSDALDTKGLVSAQSAGSASISAQCGPATNVASSSVTVTNISITSLSIKYDPAVPQQVTTDKHYIVLKVGDTLQLNAYANYSDGSSKKVTNDSNTAWSVSPDNTVISLDSTELLTAKAIGTAVVIAKYQGFDFYLTVVVQ